MHRSASTSRTSDEFFVNVSPQIKGSPGELKATEIDQLPTYDPLSDIGKKEASRFKFSENLVHLIPIVLFICAIVLWLFSHPDPGTEDLELPQQFMDDEARRTSENKSD